MVITATIESVAGKRSANGNGYLEYSLVEVGKEFAVTYRQFEGLDKGTTSGELARNAKATETYRFRTFTRPAARGNYHNVREVLARVDGTMTIENDKVTVDIFDEEATFNESEEDQLFGSQEANKAPSQTPTTPNTSPDSNRPPAGFQREAHRYIAGNSLNSISIERQVSVKAAVDLMGLRVRVLEAAISSGLAQTLADDDDALGISVLDAYWGWVTEANVGEMSCEVAEWLEYNNFTPSAYIEDGE
jgi:hypothetical protein